MTKRPNIIYIVTDQQRYDSLGCNGNPLARTPNLDALADSSLVFDRCMTPHAVCMPSRASMMTGLYPSGHGVWTNGVATPRADYVPCVDNDSVLRADHPARGPVPSHLPTLADVLAEAGYHTASVGKLHLTPTRSHPDFGYEECTQRWVDDPSWKDWHGPYFGFQEVWMTLNHGERCGGHYGHWLEAHHPDISAAREAARSGPKPTAMRDVYRGALTVESHHSTWIGDQASHVLRRQAREERPTFMWVGFPDPHHPFTPPRELAEAFESVEVPDVCAATVDHKPSAYQFINHKPGSMRVPAEAVRLMRQYTAAMVHLIDLSVQRIIETLKELGQWEDTVILFTSDHGDFLGDFGLGYKFPVADRTLNHVPMLMRVPGVTAARVSDAVSHVDLMATFCDLAGATPPCHHGQSMLHVAAHGRDPDRPVLTQHFGHGNDPRQINFTIHESDHRYTYYPGTGERELYDLSADPCELNNLARGGSGGTVEQRMHGRLLEAIARTYAPYSNRVALW
jgi:arylsulfatase A-like enzyme